ncbi:MAG TPA: ribose ABC transporter permease [Chloroflexia bacterium]|nr:ribose ABC transporter permease [Chloroflexia bacterium]
MSREISSTMSVDAGERGERGEREVPPIPRMPFRRYVQQFAMLMALGLIIIITSTLSPNFFTTANILNVARQIALTAILGAGMTVIIISGGIDLSVGGVLALGSAVIANTLIATGNIWLAVLAGIATGALVGLGNGIIIAKLKIQPFIVTLAAMTITRGVVLIYTNAVPISLLKYPDFAFFGQGYVGPIPFPIILMVFSYLLTFLLMRKTKFGRYVFAIGGNETATRIAGVPVDRYKILIYVFSGALVGLTAVMFTSRLLSGSPTIGVGFELTAITMVILGGTSFVGGQGTVWGTLVGAAILGVLANAMNLLNVSAFFQDLSTGVVILIAVIIDKLLRQERV